MTLLEHAKEAAKAKSELYVFAAVVGALENGTIRHPAEKGALRIIKIAKEEQQKALARMDRHLHAIEKQCEAALKGQS